MSPTTSEKVVNKPLTGSELKGYLLSICQRLLDAEGLLSEHIAFGKVSGTVKLTLKLENAYFPESVTSIEFAKEDPNAPVTGENEFGQQTASWTMDNPNAERVRLGLPVPVETKQLDGTKQIEHILYPADAIQDLPEQQVEVKDTTVEGKRELGLP
jgi:hypothetical protein